MGIPKARLVARGFQPQDGLDYCETYAPVVKCTSIRSLLVIVAHFDSERFPMVVVTTFREGELMTLSIWRSHKGNWR